MSYHKQLSSYTAKWNISTIPIEKLDLVNNDKPDEIYAVNFCDNNFVIAGVV